MVNIIVGLVFASIIILAIRKVYKDTKNNKCSCGSSCGKSCSDKSKCNKH
ncbi:FeoB-associated Cys-rich membrane protein [Clostridium bowmanii]|nr:FeoB-associated Cys-rich membrane protein [Clostridium bowmanii]MBU3190011.1 FeoB-associated Cys-rich membrane protein [Clostridium bowmanii]MCA1074552.1 FeoB-associated Cys-rich membrane protein [Clostridium bowmanii]